MNLKIRYLPEAAVDRDNIRLYLSQFYAGTPSRFSLHLKENCQIKGISIFMPCV